MLSRATLMRSHPLGVSYSNGSAGLRFSMYKSCWSRPKIVNPQPIRSLCPAATPGNPGSPAPMTFQPGAIKCTTYRRDGSASTRCGSFGSSGLPDTVSAPDTAQLLLSCRTFGSKGIRMSLPVKFFRTAGDKPEKSDPGEGSSLTTGSNSNSVVALSAPNSATRCACLSSIAAFPVLQYAAMRYRQPTARPI